MYRKIRRGILIGWVMILVVLLISMINIVLLNKIHFAVIYGGGKSMLPTLKDKDLSVYLYPNQLNREDIVIVQLNENNKVKLVTKRIIGLPGDHLEIKGRELYINDQLYQENYKQGLFEKDYTMATICQPNECENEQISEGFYFVLGDNRAISYDSRNFGLVHDHNIKGKYSFSIIQYD